MTDFSGLQDSLVSGFNIGQKTGGRLSGLGAAINQIAARLKQEQDNQDALNLLGQTEAIKSQYAEYKPKTREEALAFEKAKKSIDYADLPEGFVSVGGRAYRDPSYKRQESPEERNANLSNKVAESELTSMAKALPKLDQADQAINQLEDLYNKGAKPDKNPIASRITGPFDAVRAKAGFNPNLNAYINNRAGFSGLIAKGGFGEAGMLTQQDIERIKNLLPTSGSTPDEASIAFSEIKTILGSARQRFEDKKKQYTGGETNQNNKQGGQIMVDAKGNQAIVYPDGTFKEI